MAKTLSRSWDCGLSTREVASMFDEGKLLVQYTIHIERPANFHEETKNFIANELQNPRDDEDVR